MKRKKWIVIAVILVPILMSLCTRNPSGTSIESPYYDVSQVEFLNDLTFKREGVTIREQQIFSEELSMIQEAQGFILMDMFLFNDVYDRKTEQYPDSVGQITNALIEKKRERPEMPVIFISDPINGFYGTYTEKHMQTMKDNGIIVVETDLDKMRDSNFLYSGYYRLLVKPFGTNGVGWLSNPLDQNGVEVNARSLLKLANFKANHRKLLVTEQAGLITSANPHDASGYHSNVAVKVSSPVLQDVIQGERVLAQFSGVKLPELNLKPDESETIPDMKVRYLTEKGIYNGLMKYIDASEKGDTIDIGIFYISDFGLIDGLKKAAKRGVSINIVADTNKGAFSIPRDGTPNRIVLSDLRAYSDHVQVRWYTTEAEQYHTKMAYFSLKKKNVTILGSGNYTRRNLKGYNLECDLEIVTGKESDFSDQVAAYFDRIWNNRDGQFTVELEEYRENRGAKRIKYWFQEFTGLSTY